MRESEQDMLRGAASKVMWVGRATVFVVGLAVILALVLGVASMALGADGKPFILGKGNFATKVSTLTKSGAGPALSLRVGSGAPLAVNSSTKVTNLNADTLDGQDSTSFFAVGRSGSSAFCDPQGGDETGGFGGPMISCASTSLNLPRQARVFVVVESDWNTFWTGSGSSSTAPVQGFCQLWVDNSGVSETRPGERTANTHQNGPFEHTGLTHVTDVLPAGNHTFAFRCSEIESDIEFRNVQISAIMLGSG